MSARPTAFASVAPAALGLGLGLGSADVARPESGVRLADVSWTEAEKLLTPQRLVVLPLGAGAKEHGLHLRLGNDLILAEYFARRLVEARPVALLPSLTYGFYPAFLEYPGSVSLAAATQRDVVVQICRSLARHGPRRFYVLNTGISTMRPLRESAALLEREGVLLRFTDLHEAGRAAREAVREQAEGTHADEIETSMLLYIAPETVDMARAVKDGLPGKPGPLTRDAKKEGGHYSPSGVFGDPTRATRAKGQRVVEAMLADMLSDIDALARAAPLAGAPLSPLGVEEAPPSPAPPPRP